MSAVLLVTPAVASQAAAQEGRGIEMLELDTVGPQMNLVKCDATLAKVA